MLAAGVELGLFLLPISIIHYLPNFFFGSLLMLFGVEILMDWLIHSFKKVSPSGLRIGTTSMNLSLQGTDVPRGIFVQR